MRKKADPATRNWVSLSLIVAELFNFFVFGGNRIIDPDKIRQLDPVSILEDDKSIDERIRDILREAMVFTNGREVLLLLGIESQTRIDPKMIIRVLGYDYRNYDISNVPMRIVTLVFYFGKTPWNAPRSLGEYCPLGPFVEAFIPDYFYKVFDVYQAAREIGNPKEKFSSELGDYIQAYRDLIDGKITELAIQGKYDKLTREFIVMMAQQTGMDLRSEKRAEEEEKMGFENLDFSETRAFAKEQVEKELSRMADERAEKIAEEKAEKLAEEKASEMTKEALLDEKRRTFASLKTKGLMSDSDILDVLQIPEEKRDSFLAGIA